MKCGLWGTLHDPLLPLIFSIYSFSTLLHFSFTSFFCLYFIFPVLSFSVLLEGSKDERYGFRHHWHNSIVAYFKILDKISIEMGKPSRRHCIPVFLGDAYPPHLHLTTSKVMVIVWRLRGNIIRTVLYIANVLPLQWAQLTKTVHTARLGLESFYVF